MKSGVLLVNSGTPASLATRDVRAFLAGLLGDPRVVELPRLLWWPILHGIILRIRPRASAKKYAAIWTPQGSPLAIESEALRAGSKRRCARSDIPVALAMLYTGGATVPEAIDSLRAAGAEEILAHPDVSAVLRRVHRRGVRPGQRRTARAAPRAVAAIRLRATTTIRRTSTRWPRACRTTAASPAPRATC